jgi:ketosteroid isomerase-like protein
MDDVIGGEKTESEARAVVEAFLEAFNRRDVDGIIALMSEDCVFESASPAPDGKRFVGQRAVREAWEQLFAGRQNVSFEGEETFVTGDRAVARWIMRWTADGKEEHARGLDIFRVANGKIADKLAYVKR